MSDNHSFIKSFVIGLGVAGLAVTSAFIASRFFRRKLPAEIESLGHKIKAGWEGNEGLSQIKIKSVMNLQFQSVKYEIKLLEPKKSASKLNKPDQDFDPFARENYGSFFVSELSETHTLLYNKFWIAPYHVLIVTKEFVAQNTLITANDFEQCLKVMKALNGFIYYNSGPKSGASQRHKHIQALPYNTFINSKIPIESLIKDMPGEYYKIEEFQFKHIFYRFDNEIIKSIECNNFDKAAELLENSYKECLKRLDNENLSIEYNILLTNRWMFLVLRNKESAMDKIRINAMGFTGSFIVSSEEDLRLVVKEGPFNILKEVSYPNL